MLGNYGYRQSVLKYNADCSWGFFRTSNPIWLCYSDIYNIIRITIFLPHIENID